MRMASVLRALFAGPRGWRRAPWFGVGLLVGLNTVPAEAQMSRPGTQILNAGTVHFQTTLGQHMLPASDTVTVTVGRLVALDVSIDNDVYFAGPGRLVFPHQVTNLGNDTDVVLLSATVPAGWQVLFHLDSDGDGRLSPTDRRMIDRVTLSSLETVQIFAEVLIPDRLSLGAVHEVAVQGTSATDPTITDAATDVIRGPPVALSIEKSVGPIVAAPGDTVLYTILYGIHGEGVADSVQIHDALPGGLVLVPGSVRVNGAEPEEAGAEVDLGPGNRVLVVQLGSLPVSPEPGTITFQAVLPLGLSEGQHIENIAAASWSTPAGPDTRRSEPAVLSVTLPELAIRKEAIGPDPISAGDTLFYRITAWNRSPTYVARGFSVVDTLPGALEALSPVDGAEVLGPLVRWTDLQIPVGDSIALELPVRIRDAVRDGDVVTNRVTVGYPGGPSWSAESELRHLLSSAEPSLAVAIRAEAMQAQMGDRVPMTVSATNEGEVGLRDVVVRARLPKGTALGPMEIRAYARKTSQGPERVAQQSTSQGFVTVEPLWTERHEREVVVAFVERIEPGEALAFSFEMAVVDPASPTIEVTAHATARRGRDIALGEVVASNLDQVWLRLERVRPVETRTLIGKVWLDLNEDGRQQDGEPGVAGVELWTEDGQVVRTDAFGKYSFVSVRPGRHAVRMVSSTLPVWARVADSDVAMVDADGWTTPRVNFRLVPRMARLMSTAAASAEADMPETILCTFRINCVLRAEGESTKTAASLPDTVVVEIERAPSGRGDWVWPVPTGWDVSRPADARELVDETGGRWLEWGSGAGPQRLVLRRLAATNDTSLQASVRMPPLVPAEARATDSGALLHGPAPRIFQPEDGTVLGTDRLYVGVRGEPMHMVALFEGERLIGEAQLRPDGIHDFIDVHLSGPGTHRLRLRMKNSWGQERWDSIQVHVSGPPAAFAQVEPIRVRALETFAVAVELQDAWGIPVTRPAELTIDPGQLQLLGEDQSSSVGFQVYSGSDGKASIMLQAGAEVGTTRLRLATSSASVEVPVTVIPALAPFQVTAIGQLGLGSAGEGFGAMSARGRLGESTVAMLSYDSRSLDAGRIAFARDVDPLEEGLYPILGDASVRRNPAPSRDVFFMRLERELDYLAYGDLDQGDFSEGLKLGGYRRAITGAELRLRTGPLLWNAFGSFTGQALRHQLLPGDGTSGPYLLGESLIPGTERVTVQVRDPRNSVLVVAEHVLLRYTDYDVDPVAGRLLLKRPLSALDGAGNLLYLSVTYETLAAANTEPVWGVRARTELGDSTFMVPLGLQYVRDDMSNQGYQLATFEGGLRTAGAALDGELAYALQGDSADMATRVSGNVSWFDGRVKANAQWLRVGAGFVNPSEQALRGGVESFAAEAEGRVGNGSVSLRHGRDAFGIAVGTRQQNEAAVAWKFGRHLSLQGAYQATSASRDTLRETTKAVEARTTVSLTPWLQTWLEGRLQVASAGTPLQDGHFAGGGAAVQLGQGLALELRHLFVQPDADDPYNLTSVGLRSDGFSPGTQLWGNYQLQGGISGRDNAAVVGLNQRLRLGDVTLNGHFERRAGVERAPLLSPIRAMPLGEREESYWAAGIGLEYLPRARPCRMSGRLEWKDGVQESSRLASFAGDVTFGGSFALLARQQWLERERSPIAGAFQQTRGLHGIVGFAYRPAWSDGLNALLKADWKSESNPASGLLGKSTGESERLIFAAEAIWSPVPALELGTRYGRRMVRQQIIGSVTGDLLPRTTDADFVGARTTLQLMRWLAIRAEGQALRELASGSLTWSGAPSAVLLLGALELGAGQRYGPLVDPDFVRHRGAGWFANIGFRFTESTASNVADFWRARLVH